MTRLIDTVKSKPPRYWIEALVLIVLGVYAGHYVSSHSMWLDARYSLYDLMQKTNWRKSFVQHTFVVTVDDDDFWKGDFQRRSPVRRDLLASLVSHLSDAQAKVIAVDFDLRSPVPDGKPRETQVYQFETDKLIQSIRDAGSQHHAVVLPATIGFGANKSFVLQSDIYSDAHLPGDFFHTGYIALPPDARVVPLELKIADGSPLDSFALAAVRAYRTKDVSRIKDLNIFPFCGYLQPSDFPSLTANQIDKGLQELQAKQGTGGLPQAPPSAQTKPIATEFAAIAPPPDSKDAVDVAAQIKTSDAVESEIAAGMRTATTEDALASEFSSAPAPAVALGQTLDEVTSILGKPTKTADLGTKKIYYYDGMKVTFKAGKVTNIE